MRHRPVFRALAMLPLLAGCVACVGRDGAKQMLGAAKGGRPDSLPVMLNADPPFRIPHVLYDQRVQGNVTLRLFVDVDGRARVDSTAVVESSGYAGLDSAAVAAVPELRFRPALRGSEPVAVSIRFPVHFRHPDALPLPGDSALNLRGMKGKEP